MRPFSLFLTAVVATSLSGCSLIYKLPTRQGNVLDQDELDKVEVGMTREQIKFLLGTPMAATPLQPNRWDYVGYYKDPRGKTYNRKVSLYFEGDKLARMDGAEAISTGDTDLEKIEAVGAKERAEEQREDEKSKGGIVISPKK